MSGTGYFRRKHVLTLESHEELWDKRLRFRGSQAGRMSILERVSHTNKLEVRR